MLMYKITFNALLLSFLFCNAVSAQDENSFQLKPRPKEFELYGYQNDSLIQLKQTPNASTQIFESKLPYPIIFIHGLNSSSETWNASTAYFDSQYSFTYGGRFDFCLNADGNNATTNKNFYPIPGADIAAFESSVINGDYYYVNFNVKVDGSWETDVLSNQSAIAKQGAALKKVVERVLQLTGKDKVILVGHSMGGLCSREYIQNTFNWQADNRHHVAKLLTVGTPHGGSNASDNPIAVFTSVDRQSEAVRDLKTTYYYSGDAGKFLFGGTEVLNSSSMNDNSYSPDFYSLDVNCNGSIGDAIQGLNQKPIDNLIDFSNVIGRITNAFGSNITTDGVVEEPSSNLNTYFPALAYPAKIFYFNSGWDLIENHTELPGYYYQIMQGLDEPNFKELAYEVATNKNYIGFTTVQSNSSNADNDYFKFNVADNVNANVVMSNIVTSVMNASILDSTGTVIGGAQNNIGSTLSFTRTLAPGSYFLKITSTTPANTNYQTPYQFAITSTLTTADNLIADFKFYPNPVKDMLHLENMTFTKASVYSVSGQLIDEVEFDTATTNNTLNMGSYANGIYLIKLENDAGQQTIKVIKQ